MEQIESAGRDKCWTDGSQSDGYSFVIRWRMGIGNPLEPILASMLGAWLACNISIAFTI